MKNTKEYKENSKKLKIFADFFSDLSAKHTKSFKLS